ncbi:hypothetical protein SDC9_167942 [bioreactor metagenome]|uniref:Uncharacterized protein n=1 Tax=bioreactor metagenome TaxID=1076179 RepID=A0A645G9I2_9ZZZZ
MRVLELGAARQHLCREVEGKALIDAQGDILILIPILDLDEVILFIDVDVQLQLVNIAADR